MFRRIFEWENWKTCFPAGLLLFVAGVVSVFFIPVPFVNVILGVALITLSGILIAVPFVEPASWPIFSILGLNALEGSRWDQPDCNVRMGGNFLVSRNFIAAYEHAVKLIRYYPKEVRLYEVGYWAVKFGELGEVKLRHLDALAVKNLGEKLERDELTFEELVENHSRIGVKPPGYEGVKARN